MSTVTLSITDYKYSCRVCNPSLEVPYYGPIPLCVVLVCDAHVVVGVDVYLCLHDPTQQFTRTCVHKHLQIAICYVVPCEH